jgi:histidinol dehydrogenase
VIEIAPGLFGGEQVTPFESVALYIPRGTAAYPSVLLMLGIPAWVAGVERVCVVSPPSADGSIDAATLYAAQRLGITEVYRMGGAGAVAALAYGTDTVPAVQKVVGPSNIYATAAKRLLADRIDPGPPAGPSESIVLADGHADVDLVAADVLIEAEHGPYSASLLVTPDEALGRAVAEKLPSLAAAFPQKQQDYITRVMSNYGGVVLTGDLDQAIEVCNAYAAEHLQVHTQNPWEILPRLRHAGEIMLGPWTPTSICNYALGVNAILPTGGRAKTASVVTVWDFLKRTSVSYATQEGFESLADHVIRLADFEGFPAHSAAVKARKK